MKSINTYVNENAITRYVEDTIKKVLAESHNREVVNAIKDLHKNYKSHTDHMGAMINLVKMWDGPFTRAAYDLLDSCRSYAEKELDSKELYFAYHLTPEQEKWVEDHFSNEIKKSSYFSEHDLYQMLGDHMWDNM